MRHPLALSAPSRGLKTTRFEAAPISVASHARLPIPSSLFQVATSAVVAGAPLAAASIAARLGLNTAMTVYHVVSAVASAAAAAQPTRDEGFLRWLSAQPQLLLPLGEVDRLMAAWRQTDLSFASQA